MKIRINAKVATNPCKFRKSCKFSCEWCETHSYSESCVPMLLSEIEDIEIALSIEKEFERNIERRLKHLLQSKLILSFDEKDISKNPECGNVFQYKREIQEADKYLDAFDMIARIKNSAPKCCTTCGFLHSGTDVCVQCSTNFSNWKAWWE